MKKVVYLDLRRHGDRIHNFHQEDNEYAVEILFDPGFGCLHLEIMRKGINNSYSVIKEVAEEQYRNLNNADEIAMLLIRSFLLYIFIDVRVNISIPTVAVRPNIIYTPDTVLQYVHEGVSSNGKLTIKLLQGKILEDKSIDTALKLPSVLGDEAPSFMAEVLDILNDAALERVRQVEEEKMLPVNDTIYTNGELLSAACCYLKGTIQEWPWDKIWWKPTTPERDYAKAIALIVAHIQMKRRIGG